MKRLVFALFVISTTAFVTGCAATGVYRDIAVEKASEFTDQVTDDSMWWLCKGMSLGAWRRKIGNSPFRVSAWTILCSEMDSAPLLPDEPLPQTPGEGSPDNKMRS